MKRTTRATSAVVLGLCAYETVAITTGRVPTVSKLCREYRWVEAGLFAALLAHLHHKMAEEQSGQPG